MKDRKKLHKLVVATLITAQTPIRASQIYSTIKEEDSHIMRAEKVKNFKSFVRIIASFECLKQHGSGVKSYSILKVK